MGLFFWNFFCYLFSGFGLKFSAVLPDISPITLKNFEMQERNNLFSLSKRQKNILLCLTLFDQPISINEVVETGIANPAELWHLLKTCEKELIFKDYGNGRIGYFEWQNADLKNSILLESKKEQWEETLKNKKVISLAISFLKKQIDAKNRDLMEVLFGALLQIKCPDMVPDGEVGFLRIIVESCKYFIYVYWRSQEQLEFAYQLALKYNDLYSQASLQLQLAATYLRPCNEQYALEVLQQVKEKAQLIKSSRLIIESNILHAGILICMGDLNGGISLFEELLGDVPNITLNLDEIFRYDSYSSIYMLVLLAFAYNYIGRQTQGIDLMRNVMNLGKKTGDEAIIYFAENVMCMLLIEYKKFEYAENRIEKIYEFWKSKKNEYIHLWNSSVLFSAVLVHKGFPEMGISVLKENLKEKEKPQIHRFINKILWDILEYLEIHGFEKPDGFDLDADIQTAINGTDQRLRGIAYYFAAKKLIRQHSEHEEIESYFRQSEALLKKTGANIYLIDVLEKYSEWKKSVGENTIAIRLLSEAANLKSLIPLLGKSEEKNKNENLAYMILDLGRLFVFNGKSISWGELTARISGYLGAERSIFILSGSSPSILAYRGGSLSWANAMLNEIKLNRFEKITKISPPVNDQDTDTAGEVIVIPFEAKNLRLNGWLCLENRQLFPATVYKNSYVYEILSIQLSIVFENYLLWKEKEEIQNNLEKENIYYHQTYNINTGNNSIIGKSQVFLKVLDLVTRVAPTDTTILITGETGTGKELIAHELYKQSSRKDSPFVTVNIASLAPGLVTSELFGHEKGAFTGATELRRGRFELADKGTIFLDEIGELSLEDQIRLLRVLQEGTFERVGGTKSIKTDFRLIAATNRDLVSLIKTGKFREDLFYRLNVFPIKLPPLRERKDDICILALFFMEKYGRKLGRNFKGVSEKDMYRLIEYSWPGNIRELMHLIERSAILSEGPMLKISEIHSSLQPIKTVFRSENRLRPLCDVEREYILEVLRQTGGRITGAGGAADILKLKPPTLLFRINKLGLNEHLEQIRLSKIPKSKSKEPELIPDKSY